MLKLAILIWPFLISAWSALSQATNVKEVPVAMGWSKNSVNTVIFRKNSLVSHRDWQYIAFYDQDGFVVLGKRRLIDSVWELKKTIYRGNTADAHNAISIMIDGDGYLHMAWDHHNGKLRYVQSKTPGSLELTEEMPMTGSLESSVCYPEFYRMPNGNLIFLYRNGSSGKGNLVLNRFDLLTRKWLQVHGNLVSGEDQRNAYWQASVDAQGTIHLSWVWRETGDVETNHDMAYASSKDGGQTWQNSNGNSYHLPITQGNAGYILRIPQQFDLINQTSMTTDEVGNVFIASYWRVGKGAPQYRVLYKKGKAWKIADASQHKTFFTLKGAGTKAIPISRPQVIAHTEGRRTMVAIIFRDEERGNKVSVSVTKDIGKTPWTMGDLRNDEVGAWEPTYDTQLWKEKRLVHLYIQRVQQGDGEGLIELQPQMISVLEWTP